MLFPEIAPSRSDIQREIVDALKSPAARVYVDSSVLIHCYEMSKSACDELLSVLDSLGDRVRIPLWCAKETWEHTRRLTSKRPLQKTTGQLNKRLAEFQTHSLRYVDERTFQDLSVEEFTTALEEAVGRVEQLARKVEKIEPTHDAASARLLPFVTNRALNSNMVDIYSEIQETGDARYSHEVPPGFGDGGARSEPDGEYEGDEAFPVKGKRRNRFGDLIIWLEAMADCGDTAGQHLVVLTRDNTKKDWVYNPARVTEDGRLQQNGGVITLALPLLVQEAKRRCDEVKTVHVISLELFTQIMRTSFSARVGNLARALQTSAKPTVTSVVERSSERPVPNASNIGELSFGSADMMFEPSEQEVLRPIWSVLNDLEADSWAIQNEAASRLPDLLADASDDELKQAGRRLLSASNEDSVGAVEMAVDLVKGDLLPAHAKANIIIGLLAETYFAEDGEPKKPTAHSDIVNAMFEQGRDPQTREAFEIAATNRLAPFKRLYLALPGEEEVEIRLEVQTRAGKLLGIQANDKELLEVNAPESRRLPTTESPIAVSDLQTAIAREFVIPKSLFKVEGPSNFEVTIPERMGFIAWGPHTGEQLR